MTFNTHKKMGEGGYVSRYDNHTDRHNYHGTENHRASQDKHNFVESRHVPPRLIESLIFFTRGEQNYRREATY